MIRFSLPYIYNIAANLEPLLTMENGSKLLKDVGFNLYMAKQSIVEFHATGSIYSDCLRQAHAAALELVREADAIMGTTYDPEREVDASSIFSVKRKCEQYKAVLMGCLGAANTYMVAKQGAYDANALLEDGESLFPADISVKAPEAIFDSKECAKCLAYAIPTACGFHVFRVVECVLRRYYHHVTGGNAPPKVRNIAVYVNALTQSKKGNPKVLASLKQMSDLHRNPLIHPDTALTMDEAIATIGMARSVVTAMLGELPAIPPTTSAPPASP